MGRWLVGIAIVIAIAAGAGWATIQYLWPQVEVTAVARGPVVEAFYATGTVSAQREYSVRANTSGIVRVLVDKGNTFKKGDCLAIVENAELKFAVDQATAELHRKQELEDDAKSPVLAELRAKLQAAQDMLDIATKDEKRVIGLMEHGATSQTDLDTSMNRVKTVWSDVQSLKSQIDSKKIDLHRDVVVAQAALESAQWDLDQATLRSPIDGTVLDWPISSGTRVAVNDHILQLADVSPNHLVMRAQVDEEDKNRLRPPSVGDDPQVVKMTLYAYPAQVFTGYVDKIYDKADPDRRTYEVDVRFANSDVRLAAGMTGELNFLVAERSKALIVPTQAVQSGSVTVVRDGRLEQPNIVLGLKSVERTEIISGLNEGDTIVISPTLGLGPGQRVRTHLNDPLVAADLNRPAEADDSFKGFR